MGIRSLFIFVFLMGVLMVALSANHGVSSLFTDSGGIRCGKMIFSESQHTVAPAYSWDRMVTITIKKGSIMVNWQLNQKGGKVHKSGSKKLTEAEYRKFCRILLDNNLFKLKDSDLGIGGFGATSCTIEMHLNGLPEWKFEFTGLQASKVMELKNIKNAFLSFLPPE